MVDPKRQLAIFRSFMKDRLREKGLSLTGSFFSEAEFEVEKMNRLHHFEPPLEVIEVLELYREFASELAEEHLGIVTHKIEDMKVELENKLTGK